ncbi:hypothetical protein B0F90DRAFT_1952301 [Multifurca ochricompacta]|uniref:SUI1 domain-containing protein n=1 Tax=Multifurca ochricompacta TaxID=376703 RepID=A0AAD4M235_9AGAM|nr:hypothetical protein B0F90DRAFT_1952301 [Multifurca ochricompacta]
MFKKPPGDIKTSAPLKSSERRKLRARIAERFQLTAEIADALVPDGLLSQKFSTYNGEPGMFYLSGDGDPLWFSIGKGSDELIPTVYALWKHPTLLPILTTPAAVIPVLVGGADLMVPGVVQTPLEKASVGTLVGIGVAVAAVVRGPPLAVGRMAVDPNSIDHGVTKGKAVLVLHTWKDHLWALGSKKDPPEAVPVAAEAEKGGSGGSGGEGEGEGDNKETGNGGSGGDEKRGTTNGGDTTEDVADAPQELAENIAFTEAQEGHATETEEKLSPEEVSARLRAALLHALQTTLTTLPSSAFPMPTTTLYTAHILPARPFSQKATTPVDIKHSTFKSLTAFLRTAEKGGLLKLKDPRQDAPVVAVYPTHPDVDAHQPHRTVGGEDKRRRLVEEREAQQAADAANAEKSLTVTELWKPHLGTVPIFRDLELDTSALYTHAEVKSALITYVQKHELVNRVEQQYLNVSADAAFSAGLYGSPNAKGATPAPEFAKREEALSALFNRMQPWYRIAIGGDEPVTKKGALRPIAITAKIRQGRKACTLITGFEPYRLSADALADALRVRCASSTSVSPVSGGGGGGGHEVMVQGKQIPTVIELLGSMGIPKKWIEATDMTDKKKK